jgi:hypothetical protein
LSDIAAAGKIFVITVERLPATVSAWVESLSDPNVRQIWQTKGLHLAFVLGSGFFAAAVVGWSIRRLRRRDDGQSRPGALTLRILHLTSRFIVDMLPVVVFVALTYILLALIDVGHELRLVAIALINASIVSRLVLAVSAFLFAPDTSHLRLWHIGDETAQYIHQWVRRLTFVSVYGFFGLQIGLLMGLDAPLYLILLRLLGLSIVALLLVLIAQNREEVARAIAGGADGDGDGNAPLTSLIRGLARVWHLATGLYLILVPLPAMDSEAMAGSPQKR